MERCLLVTESIRSVVGVLCLLLLLAGGAAAQEVHTDYDHEVDFSKYKTFAWVASKSPTEGFADKRIKHAVEQQLKVKGLQLSAGATSDLYIVYKVGVTQRTSASETDFDYNSDRLIAPKNPPAQTTISGGEVGRRPRGRSAERVGLARDGGRGSLGRYGEEQREDREGGLQDVQKIPPPPNAR
jgi:hypothetical protein